MAIRVPLSTVSLSEREHLYVREAMESSMISSAGPAVRAFEAALASRLEVAHVVATSSGTCALELALRALAVGPGDEVLVPALTFASPVAAVLLVGATPILVDVSEATWTIDPVEARRHRTRRTKAIIAVDVFGHPSDYDALAALDLPIIEDAAEAAGARYKGRPVGSLGDIAILSFHANKVIATGEGGCVATNDPLLAERARCLGNFGMSPALRYWHEVPGHNHRMSNLVAAVGLAQTERWDELIAARAEVARFYDAALAGTPVTRRPVADWAEEATWLYTIASERRTEILDACAAAGIDARAIWPAVPDQPAFRAFAQGHYPVARWLSGTALWLPTSASLSIADLGEVAAAVFGALACEPAAAHA
ncbi:DegT/DnrJ/EryC1/StrS family aminotransferase [Methylobacterium nodulans]|uniref:DegT/DnrJ/EryC1/StrS aminotransferase n=1 Tax=Methylobacterium nodulans (strain LMG 21967 / CNCM I-2342 / ORS 2060) TaxID=460265 RepID=B8IGJ8_METNO|nr:DegT/DnrJ/EryC1/StrS family aminotransferase [Methylobacterium nodulans]ACL55898.1 DegT/DnrJ/EryC1/StrS aminotransferase [Methylobacterium nodulans ORS 2060]